MNGRHAPPGQSRPESEGTRPPSLPNDVRNEPDGKPGAAHQDDAGSSDPLKKLALWIGLALCIVFIAWVAWGFLQFNDAIDHPREGGFSGWQCDVGRDCGS